MQVQQSLRSSTRALDLSHNNNKQKQTKQIKNKTNKKTLTIPKNIKLQRSQRPWSVSLHCASSLGSLQPETSLWVTFVEILKTEIWKSKPNKYDGRTSWLSYHIFSSPGQPLFARVAWLVSELGKSGETVFCVGNWWPSDVSMMVYHDTLWWSDGMVVV